MYSACEASCATTSTASSRRYPQTARLEALPHGDEAYFSVGRDGLWERPLPGRIDELRVSDNASTRRLQAAGQLFPTAADKLPSRAPAPARRCSSASPPPPHPVIELGSRKHLFIDDAVIAAQNGIEFVPNPPKRMEKVADQVRGHLSVVEDEQGLIRLYYRGPDDYLALMTSRDGVHWETPDIGHGEYLGERNIVLPMSVGLGTVIFDPDAPARSATST